MDMEDMQRRLKRSDLMKLAPDADGTVVRATLQLSKDDVHISKMLGEPRTLVQIFATLFDRVWTEVPSFLLHQLTFPDEVVPKGALFTKYSRYQLDRHISSVMSRQGLLGLSMKVTHAGKSALTFQSCLKSETNQAVLAAIDICGIYVDPDSRRPAPIPELFRKKLKHLPKPKMVSLGFDLPDTLGLETFSLLCDVEKEFLDSNGHVNMFSYQLLIINCVQRAFDRGLVINDKCSLKEFVIEYAGEAVLGDTLKTDIWKVDENTLHVMVTKSGQKIVSSSLLFYDRNECGGSVKSVL